MRAAELQTGIYDTNFTVSNYIFYLRAVVDLSHIQSKLFFGLFFGYFSVILGIVGCCSGNYTIDNIYAYSVAEATNLLFTRLEDVV